MEVSSSHMCDGQSGVIQCEVYQEICACAMVLFAFEVRWQIVPGNTCRDLY